MDVQALHDQIDYGPLCKGTWADYGYPGRTNLGDTNLTCAQPRTRNMTQRQIDAVSAKWDRAFKTPSVQLNTKWAVVPAGVRYYDCQADYYSLETDFDYDCDWLQHWCGVACQTGRH